jgi:hypothetical protein
MRGATEQLRSVAWLKSVDINGVLMGFLIVEMVGGFL